MIDAGSCKSGTPQCLDSHMTDGWVVGWLAGTAWLHGETRFVHAIESTRCVMHMWSLRG